MKGKKITKKKAQEALKDLEVVRETMFKGRKPRCSPTQWERERERKKVNEKLGNVKSFVEKAVSALEVEKSCGRPKKLGLVERSLLFFMVVLVGKSNRYCEGLLEFFEPFFGFKVNYKYIERLYSDEY